MGLLHIPAGGGEGEDGEEGEEGEEREEGEEGEEEEGQVVVSLLLRLVSRGAKCVDLWSCNK